MKLLLDERQKIIAISNYIEYGVWGNVGDAYSWSIGGNLYVMGDHFTTQEVDEVPIHVKENKYFYINGEFVLDEDVPNEYKEKINNLEEDLTNTQEGLVEQYEANMSYEEQLIIAQNELTETQIALVEQYEANILLETRCDELEKKLNSLIASISQ